MNDIIIQQGDYIDPITGLLTCGNCHTAKQTRIVFMNAERTVICLCKCGAESAEADRKAFEAKLQKWRAEKIKRRAFAASVMNEWTFENDDGSSLDLTKVAKSYVENFDELSKNGKGLLLYGDVGCGKTFAACEIANALIERGHICCLTSSASLLNVLQDIYTKQERMEEFARYDLLIIDDLGVERTTEFAKEQLYNVVNLRYIAQKPMIITTNLDLEKIKKPDSYEDKRLYDRILERCFPVKVDGKNKRYQAIRDGYAETKALLGL